ncbi:MAG: cytochrome c [Burkholderiaceae bacterium]|nr:MAG: cytochrome c [Burkholderiaceae bacterium]TBR77828.1 MAG: cytochrome c [Burkholderiaceae bacterium]
MRSLIACCGVALTVITATARAGGNPGDSQRIDAGRRVYIAQCAACHGLHGEGQPNWDRPNATGEMPAPPHDRTGHTWKHSDAMLYRLIKSGWRDPFNKTQRLTMPAFGQVLSPKEIRDVIEYLKTMWTPEQRRFQLEESQQAPFPPEAR